MCGYHCGCVHASKKNPRHYHFMRRPVIWRSWMNPRGFSLSVDPNFAFIIVLRVHVISKNYAKCGIFITHSVWLNHSLSIYLITRKTRNNTAYSSTLKKIMAATVRVHSLGVVTHWYMVLLENGSVGNPWSSGYTSDQWRHLYTDTVQLSGYTSFPERRQDDSHKLWKKQQIYYGMIKKSVICNNSVQ